MAAKVTVISTDRPGDNLVPGWTSRWDVISVHDVLRSELWRFTKTGTRKRNEFLSRALARPRRNLPRRG